MRWRSGLLTASSVALLAGCGGGHRAQPPPKPPRIPGAVAARLAAEADRVAALTPGTCEARDAAQRFQADVIRSIGSVPSRYQEPLASAANDLAARLAVCAVPTPAQAGKPPKGHGHGDGHGHGHGQGKRKREND
ncbi:MAG TPA: hypothetical protein VFJ75_02930 [Gaiellaceae bacterium]|nr:hypothetical protein [Gaiellaceae bacterium]